MTEIILNRGGDQTFQVFWPHATSTDAVFVPLNLTGYTVEAYDVHASLLPNLTLTIGDAAAGRIDGRIEWAESLPVGQLMLFRVRITSGANNESSPQIPVIVQ